MDFGIQTEALVVLGEAKWRSGVAKAQGTAHNKNQIELRQMFCQQLGQRVFPGARFVVLAVSPDGGLLPGQASEEPVVCQELTWDAVCNLPEHPLRAELLNYLDWGKAHSKAP